MNGVKLDPASNEMKAIEMYYKWLARGKVLEFKDNSQLLVKLAFLPRAANPNRGHIIFKANCARCHGDNGEGILDSEEKSYLFPPLWGQKSYQLGSSMSRVSTLARFVKATMPFDLVQNGRAYLSDEDSWDVAAYVNSQARPKWVGKILFPSLSEKAFDYPIGPYADSFSVLQHKYGPYQPIVDYWEQNILENDITKNDKTMESSKLALSHLRIR